MRCSSRFTCAYNLLGSEIRKADASATAPITASMVTTAASSCPSMLAADTAAVVFTKTPRCFEKYPSDAT